MTYKNTLIAICLLMPCLLAVAGPVALASEITGTLSTDSSNTTVNNPIVSQPSSGSGGNFLGFLEQNGVIIKTVLVSLVVIEVVALAVLHVISKRKKRDTSAYV